MKNHNTELHIFNFYHVANLSKWQMTAYAASLQKPIPKASCLQSLNACKKNIETQSTIRGAAAEEHNTCIKHELTISLVTDFKKCGNHKHDCVFNLMNGKCTDPYVIENIGKKFFPNAYAKKR